MALGKEKKDLLDKLTLPDQREEDVQTLKDRLGVVQTNISVKGESAHTARRCPPPARLCTHPLARARPACPCTLLMPHLAPICIALHAPALAGSATAASTSDAKAAYDWRMLHSLGALLATAPRAFPYLCTPAPPLHSAPAPSHAPPPAPPHAPPCIR